MVANIISHSGNPNPGRTTSHPNALRASLQQLQNPSSKGWSPASCASAGESAWQAHGFLRITKLSFRPGASNPRFRLRSRRPVRSQKPWEAWALGARRFLQATTWSPCFPQEEKKAPISSRQEGRRTSAMCALSEAAPPFVVRVDAASKELQ